MAKQLYCIGYQGKSLEQIDQILREQAADLFDIRLKAWSRNPQFIGKTLSARYGNRYRHVPALGNLAYKTGGIEIADYAAGKAEVDAANRAVVLMCMCRNPRDCHRTVVAGMLRRDGFEVCELSDQTVVQDDPQVTPVLVAWRSEETPGGTTLVEFGPPDKDAHEKVQEWRRETKGGLILNYRGPSHAILHRVECPIHLGNTAWERGEGLGLGISAKACSTSESELRDWLEQRTSKAYRRCEHCSP